MDPVDPDFVRSFRKSRLRVRILGILVELGEAYPSQLARLAKTDLRSVCGAMHGFLPGYSEELSLVELGFAVPFESRVGEAYRATEAAARFLARLDVGEPFGL